MAEETPEQSQYTFADYAPTIQTELKQLVNVENLLKKVKGMDGDEAFSYVQARKWVAEKAAFAKIAEEARLDAVAKVQAKEAAEASTEKPKLVPQQ